MKVVVTAPAGHVGSRVVRLLIQAGVRPTLLARHPGRLDPATGERSHVVEADLGDVAAVVRATRDTDALFWGEPPTADPDADPVAWYPLLGATAARAVTENGIGRTVFLSSIGAEKRSGAGEIDGLARTEEELDATGASVLHLRCGYFFTNLLGELDSMRDGVLRAPMPLDYAQPWVDPRDIGEIAAARLLSEGWSGRHVQAVHGPRRPHALPGRRHHQRGHRPPGPSRDHAGGDSARFAAIGGTRRQAGRRHCRDVRGDARRLRRRRQAHYRHHDTDHPRGLGPRGTHNCHPGGGGG
jgi:uncharacterized protein YbjT (DUF2867 family)